MSANESAFPSSWQETTPTGLKLDQHAPGMTLRDWFAGQALASAIEAVRSNIQNAGLSLALASTEEVEAIEAKVPDMVAGMAYQIADAMLRAREKKED